MLNKIAGNLLIAIFVLNIVGCSEGSILTSRSQPSSTPQLELNNDNWDLALGEAKGAQEAYMGSSVDLRGKVAQVLKTSQSESQFTIETGTEITFVNRTLVVVEMDPNLTEGQWVQVQGVLHSYWNTQNLMGGELRLPVVAARKVSTISRSAALPAIRTVIVDQSITRHGLIITLEKLAIADSETRVYIHAQNTSPNKAFLHTYSAVLVQGTQQIKRKSVFSQDAEQPDTTLVSGTETQGVLLFDPLNPDTSPVRLIWEGPRTDDYLMTFDDWEWVISW